MAREGHYDIVEAVGEAVKKYNPELILVGFAGSKMVEKWRSMSLKVVAEVFADRAIMLMGL